MGSGDRLAVAVEEFVGVGLGVSDTLEVPELVELSDALEVPEFVGVGAGVSDALEVPEFVGVGAGVSVGVGAGVSVGVGHMQSDDPLYL